MKYRIDNLPHWVLTDEHVAFYDNESLTAIRMVARLYVKMQDLISKYNLFYTDTEKLVNDAIDYMKTNLEKTCSDLFEEAILNNKIKANLNIEYNNENLVFSIGAGVNE